MFYRRSYVELTSVPFCHLVPAQNLISLILITCLVIKTGYDAGQVRLFPRVFQFPDFILARSQNRMKFDILVTNDS